MEGEYLAGKEFSSFHRVFNKPVEAAVKWGENGEKVYIKVCQAEKKERRFLTKNYKVKFTGRKTVLLMRSILGDDFRMCSNSAGSICRRYAAVGSCERRLAGRTAHTTLVVTPG